MQNPSERAAPINIPVDEFRQLGHDLVDRISDHLDSLSELKVTPGETQETVRSALGRESMPKNGMDASALLTEAADLLTDHSLFIGHPKFWGYITSSSAPIGVLGDFLASAINPNLGGWMLAPMATEIEVQSIRWMAEMIGYSPDCGGILVSGGNMANFVGFLAARKAKSEWNVREEGLRAAPGSLRVYVSAKAHTWIQKAADLFGLGTDSIRWVPVDERECMDVNALDALIETDFAKGDIPFMVVGTAGTVGSGAIDPLPAIATICQKHDLWFHVDGAYGAFASVLPDAPPELSGLSEADSIALDPHKWLYSPLEAGCALVRDVRHLRDAFSFVPEYYNFADGASGPTNFFELGMQNSRGFRALKVWLGLKQVGWDGYRQMISDDVALSKQLFEEVSRAPDLEPISNSLSITTFRFRPAQFQAEEHLEELNELNRKVLEEIQASGEAFISNAVIEGAYVLRACFVNFRTTPADVSALPEIVLRAGRQVLKGMKD